MKKLSKVNEVLQDVITTFQTWNVCILSGMEIVLKIGEAFCDRDNRPYQDIRITHTVILDDPLDDPQGSSIISSSAIRTSIFLVSLENLSKNQIFMTLATLRRGVTSGGSMAAVTTLFAI